MITAALRAGADARTPSERTRRIVLEVARELRNGQTAEGVAPPSPHPAERHGPTVEVASDR
jgi:hypothetical protein